MSTSTSTPPSVTLIRAVAAERGVEPDELQFRLQEEVDTDALDALARHDGADWQLEFRVDDHDVTVESDGTVVVDGTTYG